MNIEDGSILVNWVNTTSAYINSTANETAPWYDDHPSWSRNLYEHRHREVIPLGSEFHPDTPVSISATQITSDQSDSQSWPLWMFFMVAGTLTFGSIILPLIAGHMYRVIARFSIRRRRTFRAIIGVLWIS